MRYWLIGGAVALVFVLGCGCLFVILYPLAYKDEIVAAGEQYDIQPALIAALINAESSFDKNKVSKKGAVGLMQVMPTTATYISKSNPDLFDAQTNIAVGVKYLAYLIAKFGDTTTALFAYNAGEGNVARWLKEQDVKQLTSCPFPETNAYVHKIQKTIKHYTWRI